MASEDPPEFGDGVTSAGDLYSVLESDDRRRVLRFFEEGSKEVATLEELADYLLEQEGGHSDPTAAAIALHHRGLPKLAEVGVIDYDPRTKVTRHRGHSRLEAMLPRSSVA